VVVNYDPPRAQPPTTCTALAVMAGLGKSGAAISFGQLRDAEAHFQLD
jgi:hypothetical protein